MGPVSAAGFVLFITPVVIGVIVGAVGGVVVWKVRGGLALGGFLTACVYFLVAAFQWDFRWPVVEVIWGAPSMTLTFLICSVSARCLGARTTLRPIPTTLAAFGCSLSIGFLYLLLFRLSLWVPLLVALGADVYLVLLLMRSRRFVRQ